MEKQPPITPRRVALEFKGLTEWFDIFYVGTHTDAHGRTDTYDEAYLQQLAVNSTPAEDRPFTVPLVVGHPQKDDPAYGWGIEFKVEDGVLYAKADHVEPQFADLVKEGRYPNRSVKIVQTDAGPALGHIGFLGAAAPALDGLEPIYKNADVQGAEFEFSTSTWYATSIIASFFRGMREFLIDRFDMDTADQVIPDWQIDALAEEAGEQRAEQLDDFYSFTAPPTGAHSEDPTMDPKDKQFTQEDLDAAKAQAKSEAEAEFAKQNATQQRDEFIETVLTKAVADKRVAPAQVDGLRAFMKTLCHDESEEHTLEFTLDDGSKKQVTGLSWFAKEILEGQGEHPLFKVDAEAANQNDSVDLNDGEALGLAAKEYIAEQAGKGITVSASVAVAHIRSQQTAD